MTGLDDIAPALLERLRSARRVMALTGAGVSAESGIPTFRGANGGFWGRYDPLDLASRAGYERNPQRGWAWSRYVACNYAASSRIPPTMRWRAWAHIIPTSRL